MNNFEGQYFRIEFNPEKQAFHHEKYKSLRPENELGWFTIIDCCSDQEWIIFKHYVDTKKKGKITVEFLLQCLKECKELVGFIYDVKNHLRNRYSDTNFNFDLFGVKI
jgi:hypothetical protein